MSAKYGRAAAYRESVRKKREEQKTVTVTLPSGFEWELRPPDLQGYMMTGRMPESLVQEFLKSAEKRGITPEELQSMSDLEKFAATPLSQEETVLSLIFMRELVRDACVNPRIVVGGSGDDEIDPTEIDPEDFKFIVQWCLMHSGVAGLAGLQTFREGRKERTAVDSTDGQELQPEAVEAPAN